MSWIKKVRELSEMKTKKMKEKINNVLQKEVNVESLASWSALTWLAAMYFTVITAQSYYVYLEALLG
jgi:hypothetical protein